MVVSLRLANVVSTDSVSILAHHLLAFLSKDLAPCLNTVDSDALCHVVSIQAHSWDQDIVILFLDGVLLVYVFENGVE